MTPVFVYGSLLAGLHNHDRLLAPAIERGGAEFLGPARTARGWELHEVAPDAFPAMSLGDGDGRVVGELYRVDDRIMRELDWLEGVASGFYDRAYIGVERSCVALPWEVAEPMGAWTYVQTRSAQVGRARVDGGDWRAWLARLRPKLYATRGR